MTGNMKRYEWEHHFGGIILRELGTGDDTFLQPGDDTEQFLLEIEGTNAKYTDDDVIENYFIG